MRFDQLLLEASIYLAICWLFYQALLKHNTYFTLNRVFLLLSPVAALLIPLLDHYWLAGTGLIPQTLAFNLAGTLTSKEIVKKGLATSYHYSLPIYLAGAGTAAAILVSRLLGLKQLVARSGTNKAFSFLNVKIVDRRLTDFAVIDAHETLHVRQQHSLDVLYFECLAILFWFNPFIYGYKFSIKAIHEYLADRAAAHFMGDTKSYALLLLHKSLGLSPVLSNSFQSVSLLKNRIAMLQRTRSSKLVLIRYLMIMPLLVLSILLFAMRSPAKNMGLSSAPAYPGGITQFQRYLVRAAKNSNHTNPAGQGSVTVEFIIDTEGKTDRIKVLQSSNEQLNPRAIQMLQASPQWKPGYQNGVPVRVAYHLRLNFK